MAELKALLAAARSAAYAAAALDNGARGALVCAMADAAVKNTGAILAANALDIQNAAGKISDVMLDRLRLDAARIEAMAAGMRQAAALQSPLGAAEREYTNAAGLLIRKVRVPLGVVAIIYESRPNVTGDAAALCLKSGNACVLRGGSDAICTNKAIVAAMRGALSEAGGPIDAVQLVEDTTHESARALMEARGKVDLLIPRGGAGLIGAVVNGARGVPVIETGTGICHVYVDEHTDLDMAARILYNAKTSRPSVCNAAEVCLVHQNAAAAFLPRAAKLLEGKVQLRLDARAAALIGGRPAGEKDFDTEFLDYILAVAVVDSLDAAIAHINTHGTHHSDAIVTENKEAARRFLQGVDSAAVYHNASTRFTDGGEFGLGCEMGISTQKLGARGPMGLYELSCYKYCIEGGGQLRE